MEVDKLKLPYKIGYSLTLVWLSLIVYGFFNYDSDHEDTKVAMVLFITFAGLILFPIYYITFFLYYAVLRKYQK
jgi:hypothetical protein